MSTSNVLFHVIIVAALIVGEGHQLHKRRRSHMQIKRSGNASDSGDVDADESVKKAVERRREAQAIESRAGFSVAQAREALELNLDQQRAMLSTLHDMNDTHRSDMEIKSDIADVANETQSNALAKVLGKIWSEERQYAWPFYAEHLRQEVKLLEDEEIVLNQRLAEAKKQEEEAEQKHQEAKAFETAARKKVEAKEAEEEDDDQEEEGDDQEEDDETSTEGSKKAEVTVEVPPPSAAERFVPKFNTETMPPVSSAVTCVMILAYLYFVIYTLLAVCRTVNTLVESKPCLKLEKLVSETCDSIFYAPVLSALFLAVRMRAIQLAKGDTEKFNLPQPWVQTAMYMCTFAIVAQSLFRSILAVFASGRAATPAPVERDAEGGEEVEANSAPAGKAQLAVEWVIMAAFYGGFAVVCAGALTMEGPHALWHGKALPTSAALQCTLLLATTFLLVYLLHDVFRIVQKQGSSLPAVTKLVDCFKDAKDSVNLAPMLAILFLVARMNALQVDPDHGGSQSWAQRCFYLCTFAVMFKAFAAAAFKGVESKVAKNVVEYGTFICIYVGVVAVVISMHLKQGPGDIPTAMECVITLTNLYFFAQLVIGIGKTMKDFGIEWLDEFSDSVRQTIQFAPMFSMLFVAARMRALQLTRTTSGQVPPSAGPQKWVQEAMVATTWSVVFQYLLSYLVIRETKGSQYVKTMASVLEGFRQLCVIEMYVGAVAIMIGTAVMTPETLPPYSGYQGILPGLK